MVEVVVETAVCSDIDEKRGKRARYPAKIRM